MEENIKLFIDYLAEEKGYSPNTIEAYTSDLNQLAAYVKSRGSEESLDSPGVGLNAELLSGYLRSLRERRYTPSTVARKVAAAKSFLKFMIDRGKLRSDLAPNLASPQVSKSLPKPLSVSEVRRLLAEPAKLSTIEAKRDKAMLELLYATGLRASELMAINVKDIDLKAGNVCCSGRNSRVRVIPIDSYDANEMINEIKGKKLLEGFRNIKASKEEVIDLLLKVSSIGETYMNKIDQMDLNPVFVYEDSICVVDAKLIIK